MASTATLLSVRPAIVRSSATPSGDRKPDSLRQKCQPCSSSSSSSSKWWTPLFGWSSNPDYIDNDSSQIRSSDVNVIDLEFSSNTSSSRSRFAPGGFTDEKAKQLRVKTAETTTFHDIMYHSAIASRLASDQRSVY